MARFRSLRRFDWDDEGFEHFCEPELARRRRINQQARDGKKLQVTDRTGNVVSLERAAKRLKHKPSADRILRVPQWDMDKAVTAMELAGVRGAVSNLCGTQRKRIKVKRA